MPANSLVELSLLADFGEALFPIALVRERVGVRAPEFFHHFPLRHKRTLGFRIFVNPIELLQCELRAGH